MTRKLVPLVISYLGPFALTSTLTRVPSLQSNVSTVNSLVPILTRFPAGFVPGDSTKFVIRLSESLSEFVPQLTLDFVSEISAAMTSMDKTAISQRLSCVQYMSPLIKNLAHFVNPTSPLYERSGARVRDAIRVLCDMSATQPEASRYTCIVSYYLLSLLFCS